MISMTGQLLAACFCFISCAMYVAIRVLASLVYGTCSNMSCPQSFLKDFVKEAKQNILIFHEIFLNQGIENDMAIVIEI